MMDGGEYESKRPTKTSVYLRFQRKSIHFIACNVSLTISIQAGENCISMKPKTDRYMSWNPHASRPLKIGILILAVSIPDEERKLT